MRKSRLLDVLVIGAVLALVSSATAAADPGNSPVPVVPQGSSSSAAVVPQGSSGHPNVSAWIHLTDVVKDGKDTHFVMSVTNSGNSTVYFGRVAVEWSFDGVVDDSYYGAVKGLTRPKPNNAVVPFVDKQKLWVQVGSLRPGQRFSVTGVIAVPDRDNPGFARAADNRMAKDATFFCLRAHYLAMLPGQTKPGLERRSAASCVQYTVT